MSQDFYLDVTTFTNARTASALLVRLEIGGRVMARRILAGGGVASSVVADGFVARRTLTARRFMGRI